MAGGTESIRAVRFVAAPLYIPTPNAALALPYPSPASPTPFCLLSLCILCYFLVYVRVATPFAAFFRLLPSLLFFVSIGSC